MSGPKVIRLNKAELAVRREESRRLCTSALSSLERLLARHQSTVLRLQHLGSNPLRSPVDISKVSKQATTLLRQGTGAGAVQLVSRLSMKLEQDIKDCELQYQVAVEDLLRRARHLNNQRRSLASKFTDLTAGAKAVAASDLPDKERKALEDTVQALASAINLPAEFHLELTTDSIERLGEAEDSLAAALKTFNEVRIKIGKAVDEAYARTVIRKLTATSLTPKRLKEYLEDKRPRATEKEDNGIERKLDDLLVKIACLQDTGAWNDIQRRMQLIASEQSPGRRRLLYEDLVLESSMHISRLKRVKIWREKIEALIDGAAGFGGPVTPIVEELRFLHRAGSLQPLGDLEQRLKVALAAEKKHRDREMKRKAVLESLRELGYDLHEGMETAITRGGKLVVQKRGDDEYAVAMAADDDLTLLQTEMIRFGEADDSLQQRLRDKEREESWCGDHSELLRKLAAKGLSADFKLKMKPGERSVRVEEVERQAHGRVATGKTNSRTEKTGGQG